MGPSKAILESLLQPHSDQATTDHPLHSIPYRQISSESIAVTPVTTNGVLGWSQGRKGGGNSYESHRRVFETHDPIVSHRRVFETHDPIVN